MPINIQVKSGQNRWEVSVEASGSVGELKQEIAKVSEIPAENQRLIYSGKILKDDQTVESYKIADGHAIHLVRSGGGKAAPAASAAGGESTGAAAGAGAVPSSISAGQSGGFNPLADLTGARYAGYTNLPSTEMFGPDGGLNSAVGQEEIIGMLENPIFQSQMNEMLNNPQMIDFLIQQHPHLQAMGPAAREMLQSPFFRQMLTNPDIIRQMSRLQMGMGGPGAEQGTDFPAPGSATAPDAAAPAPNPLAAMLGLQPGAANSLGGAPADRGLGMPPLDPAVLSSLFGAGASSPAPADNRPPEERYEQQLRQLNDMGFFDFDRNVAALRRSGGSVQGALDALLNGDV
ncbi:AaceriABL129Wp [[Ashbya] aceris (nom. inval.)]|nr:AaceriABL129Wp [[Ashbya] aceris (nom. inval.)]